MRTRAFQKPRVTTKSPRIKPEATPINLPGCSSSAHRKKLEIFVPNADQNPLIGRARVGQVEHYQIYAPALSPQLL